MSSIILDATSDSVFIACIMFSMHVKCDYVLNVISACVYAFKGVYHVMHYVNYVFIMLFTQGAASPRSSP